MEKGCVSHCIAYLESTNDRPSLLYVVVDCLPPWICWIPCAYWSLLFFSNQNDVDVSSLCGFRPSDVNVEATSVLADARIMSSFFVTFVKVIIELSHVSIRWYNHLILALEHILWHTVGYDEWFGTDIDFQHRIDLTLWVLTIYGHFFGVDSLRTP